MRSVPLRTFKKSVTTIALAAAVLAVTTFCTALVSEAAAQEQNSGYGAPSQPENAEDENSENTAGSQREQMEVFGFEDESEPARDAAVVKQRLEEHLDADFVVTQEGKVVPEGFSLSKEEPRSIEVPLPQRRMPITRLPPNRPEAALDIPLRDFEVPEGGPMIVPPTVVPPPTAP